MCDLFWLSSAAASREQGEGDLLDVVRASLAPPHSLTTEPAAAVGVRDELLGVGPDVLLEGGGLLGGHEQQLGTYACDDHVLSQSQGLHISRPATDIVERESPATDDHLQAMVAPAHDHVAPIKRRKSQAKKVVCIPAPTAAAGAGGRPSCTSGEVVPSDLWAWRKYGQKPIKGSPYPRGYYRCSSSKGCSARKQVEHSRTDPSMLVITYTSEHNHPWPTQRNALAGSTRPSTSKNTSLHRAAPKSATPSLPSTVTTVTTATSHHQLHRLKEEVVEPEESYKTPSSDLDLFDEMDGLIFSKAVDDVGEKLQGDKSFDPFSFFDWVGSSFGEANNKGL